MDFKKNKLFLIFVFLTFKICAYSQTMPSGYPILEENARRNQLHINIMDTLNVSFLQRPSNKFSYNNSINSFLKGFNFVPIRLSSFINSSRPYWYSPNGMIPAKGLQFYFSGGAFFSNKYFAIDFQPEINLSENAIYEGSKYLQYIKTQGDSPERYGNGVFSRIGWGQSKIVLKFGAFEGGVSTGNLWWGPGQWNSLTFSNNAPGFVHGVLGTHRAAKTFFGSFEFQLISGFPKSKKYPAYQDSLLNKKNRLKPNRDRYLNALTFSIQPKWIKGLSIGAARTVQTFSDSASVNNFLDIFPVFWGITKESVGSDLIGESDRGRDQQITVFFRQVIPKGGFEFYGEFGRRDHALNVRDLVLSPAHSRAFILGFNKIFQLPNKKFFQIRSEITQQAQSVNWVVRYKSTTPWHTNGTIGGFTNWDQAMGVGVGMGSNVQMLEISIIENLNKIGLYLERLPQHADYYDTSDLANKGFEPWVDFTAGPIFDRQWKNLIFSGRMLFTYASNYYWSQEFGPQGDFPFKKNKFSTSTQVNLIYLFNKD